MISEVVEMGVLDQEDNANFTSFEHLAYASKGLAAITMTVRKPEQTPMSHVEKFSVLDTDLCLCKLSKLLFILNEAVAQTIVSPDLQV